MTPAEILLVTQILSLAAQAAAAIPSIRAAWTQPSASTTAEQQQQITSDLNGAMTNLQQVVDHAKAAFSLTPATPAAPTAA